MEAEIKDDDGNLVIITEKTLRNKTTTELIELNEAAIDEFKKLI